MSSGSRRRDRFAYSQYDAKRVSVRVRLRFSPVRRTLLARARSWPTRRFAPAVAPLPRFMSLLSGPKQCPRSLNLSPTVSTVVPDCGPQPVTMMPTRPSAESTKDPTYEPVFASHHVQDDRASSFAERTPILGYV